MAHHEEDKTIQGAACCPKNSEALQYKADDIVRKHVYASAGTGLIPIPYIDLVGLLGVQLHMLKKLSELYHIPFKKELAKSSIGSLLGSVGSVALSGPVASLLKLVPIVGTTTSAVSMSITGGAGTYAIGKVFVQHFASGGTFLDFDPAAVREYFAQQFQEGKHMAQAAKKS